MQRIWWFSNVAAKEGVCGIKNATKVLVNGPIGPSIQNLRKKEVQAATSVSSPFKLATAPVARSNGKKKARKIKQISTFGKKTLATLSLTKRKRGIRQRKSKSRSSSELPTDSGIAAGNLRFWAKKAALEAENLVRLATEAGLSLDHSVEEAVQLFSKLEERDFVAGGSQNECQ
ncbi:hypothetical protein RIF29_29085 [Crotalaria pallida]|uniref:Uncharacterized protein n=1 Tax=Crotalaria pallida TaxID=3830 RepID=A0AAN9HTK2_CROPI